MKKLLIAVTLLTLISCGKIESPKTFFDFKGKDGDQGIIGNQGQDGINGTNGQDGTFDGKVEYVEICNDSNAQYVETLVFIDGQYMAFLSDISYQKQRLVLLEENVTYITTDTRNVLFSIENGEIICD
jgi:hypothetical protein